MGNGVNKFLDKCIELYSDSEVEFLSYFITLPEHYLHRLINLSFMEEDEDLDPEDEIGKSKEVLFYYQTCYKNRKTIVSNSKKSYKDFTLRNSEDAKLFEEFLNRLVILYRYSPKDFKRIFPMCPAVLWDKIDDLRETSFKMQRDSEEFIRCLKKCKFLSLKYNNE